VIDKHLDNLCTIQEVAELKITTCLSQPEAGEFRNLAQRPVDLSKLLNKRRQLPSNIKILGV
jgi:hypothetical protein